MIYVIFYYNSNISIPTLLRSICPRYLHTYKFMYICTLTWKFLVVEKKKLFELSLSHMHASKYRHENKQKNSISICVRKRKFLVSSVRILQLLLVKCSKFIRSMENTCTSGNELVAFKSASILTILKLKLQTYANAAHFSQLFTFVHYVRNPYCGVIKSLIHSGNVQYIHE